MKKILNNILIFNLFVSLTLSIYSSITQAEQNEVKLQSGPKEWLNIATPTKVMILGTPHLKAFSGRIAQEDFSPLINRLTHFKPDAIAVESINNADIFNYQSRLDYEDVIDNFAPFAALLANEAQQVLKITSTKAVSNIRFPVKNKRYSPSEREALILSHLAGYNISTALLHWVNLKEKEKKALNLPSTIKQKLEKASTTFNETNLIAVNLAKKLKLSNLFSIDNHSDKDIYSQITSPLSIAFQNGQIKIDKSRLKKFMTQGEGFIKQKNTIGWYAQLNSSNSVQESTYQWQAIIDSKVKQNANIARISLWELRNTQMVSNILRVAALNQGKKILVLVGLGHKAFLDDYLTRMSSIEIVQPIDYLTASNANYLNELQSTP